MTDTTISRIMDYALATDFAVRAAGGQDRAQNLVHHSGSGRLAN
jgi:hypothetical protein